MNEVINNYFYYSVTAEWNIKIINKSDCETSDFSGTYKL